MIEKIVDWSAKNKIFVFFGVAFMTVWALWSIKNIPLDAIPDLSDTQVIVYAKWDRPPQVIEDQVTYPIVSALLGAPKVKDIRAFSDYGFSYIYLIFEDGTDIYWARSRVMEYLSKVTQQLPKEANIELGPDATGVGWVYQYALVDESGKLSLEELRGFQDWHLKYALQSVKGVSEVASIGGFVKQYQVVVDPNALQQYKIPLSSVVNAVRGANLETGARVLELSGTEYMLTVKGYAAKISDIEQAVLRVSNGVPVTIKNVAKVETGPEIRRGLAELNGDGEAVGGIVVMRHGENALNTIKAVKEKISSVQLPEGVKLVAVYDRSELINRAVETLKKKLIEEMLVVSLVILIFLLHFPSAVIPIITLPIAVLFAFIPMHYMKLTSNVMSLGGIAIAVGAMVDAAIVVVENAHKELARWQDEGKKGDYHTVLLNAIKEVARPSFFSLIVIAVAFIPIFSLEGMEGRLFKPLAFTKNFAMFFAAILAITLDPAVRMLFTRLDNYNFKPRWLAGIANTFLVGKIHSEEKHPISKFLFKIYGPVVDAVLKRPYKVIAGAVIAFALTIPAFYILGREFMPPLNEGSILYMPTTLPGISIAQAGDILTVQDKLLKSFPEVVSVFGKAGRAETSTDPAPLSMMETTVLLKPQNQWRHKDRWHSFLPGFIKAPLNFLWPERITWDELVSEMDLKLKLPGVVNAWTMPIKGRIDMLTTGVRTPIGIKIYGDKLSVIESIGKDIESLLVKVEGTRSAFAERTSGGYFINFNLKRENISRYGLSVEEVGMNIMAAIGGENITQTVEGRERYPVNVRYPRELRNDVGKIERMYIPTPAGAQIPLSQLAELKIESGPGMIRDENGKLTGYVYVDVAGRDLGRYVDDAKEAIGKNIKLPAGYFIEFSGQFEFMERVKQRMKIVVPFTLVIIFILLYLSTKSYVKTFIILSAVPFSLIGAVWILVLLDYNLSIGVWSGIIALLGVDAETGIFMLLYLDLSYDDMKKKGRLNSVEDLKAAIHHGAVKRIRPKLMTAAVLFAGLLPIMWAQTHEIGADVMKRIAAPLIGGIFTSFLMELVVYPAIYFVWKRKTIPNKQ
ncbi:MAG: cation transporter [Elusimicrobia bacterium RIFOXYA2_FULL_47_53]|nr:MAG: cation transporter [Elusimicrobia bacterium RIFOXYA12_FULL_49_49]OGS15075.1 MAG: cation transporter [Elusimicrobia bacterium RIFOXYA2_FULL_47_53]OGS29413.1 MAG: cation transporter [Elusimicrobia bacterium RIFOXYB2_FULL_46_23]